MRKLCIALLFLSLTACSQTKKDKTEAFDKKTGNNPKVEIKVNKKYDPKGNLITFDSTYSYFYSSGGRDSMRVGLDTMFNRVRSAFKTDFPSNWGSEFNSVFFNDTLFKYDFLNDDYFSKRFEMNMQKMRDVFRRMDSVKINYLKEPMGNNPGKKINKK